MVMIGLAWLIPFFLLINISLKPGGFEVYGSPFQLPSKPAFSNYSTAWQGSALGSLGHGFVSSAIITFISVFFLILIGSLTAYTIARRGGRASRLLMVLFTFGLVLPVQLAIIPLYTTMRHLGLVGDYLGMIVLNVGLLMPLAVFLYTGFIRALPR